MHFHKMHLLPLSKDLKPIVNVLKDRDRPLTNEELEVAVAERMALPPEVLGIALREL